MSERYKMQMFHAEKTVEQKIVGVISDNATEDDIAGILAALMNEAVRLGLDPATIQARFMAIMVQQT